MIQSTGRPPKPNLLALPSLPGYLLIVMAVVIIGALVASSLPGSPLRAGPFLVVLFTVLVFRDFLMQPERERRTHQLTFPGATEYETIKEAIATQARRAGLNNRPELRVAQTPGALFALGTFRHGYIAIAPDVADVLEANLRMGGASRRQAEAALLHEIQHLSQRDLIFVGLGRSLMRVGTAFSIFGLLLMMGVALVAFALPVTPLLDPAFPDQLNQLQPGLGEIWRGVIPPGFAQAAAQPPDLGLTLLFLLNAFLPLVVTVGLMYVLIWPRLLRTREFYADAGVAGFQGNSQNILKALNEYGNRARLAGSVDRWRRHFQLLSFFSFIGTSTEQATSRWIRFHPTLAERYQCIEQPMRAFGSARVNGLLAGLLSVLLDVLLVGALTAIYAAQVPGVIPVIVGTLAASFVLLPEALEGRMAAKAATWIVGSVLFWRMGWHLLNLILLWFGALFLPELTSEILSSFVHNMAGATILIPEGIVPPSALLEIAVASTLFWFYLAALIAVTLSGAIVLEWWLRQKVMRWYALPGGARWLKWLLAGVTVWTLALVGGLWLPLIALIAPVSPTESYSSLGWVALILNALFVIASATLFWIGEWRYAGRCPKCRSAVPGKFSLGKQCPSCGETLWPELIAQY